MSLSGYDCAAPGILEGGVSREELRYLCVERGACSVAGQSADGVKDQNGNEAVVAGAVELLFRCHDGADNFDELGASRGDAVGFVHDHVVGLRATWEPSILPAHRVGGEGFCAVADEPNLE